MNPREVHWSENRHVHLHHIIKMNYWARVFTEQTLLLGNTCPGLQMSQCRTIWQWKKKKKKKEEAADRLMGWRRNQSDCSVLWGILDVMGKSALSPRSKPFIFSVRTENITVPTRVSLILEMSVDDEEPPRVFYINKWTHYSIFISFLAGFDLNVNHFSSFGVGRFDVQWDVVFGKDLSVCRIWDDKMFASVFLFPLHLKQYVFFFFFSPPKLT